MSHRLELIAERKSIRASIKRKPLGVPLEWRDERLIEIRRLMRKKK